MFYSSYKSLPIGGYVRALVFGAALLLGASSALASGVISIASRPISRLDLAWWKTRFIYKQEELAKTPVDLLWLGDSITENWEKSGPEAWRDFAPAWQHFYGDRHAVNLGFRGDSTCHLLWRLEHGELDHIHPRAAIILIGANNFGRIHTDADQTYDGIRKILSVVRQRLPDTQVILIGVLPSIRSAWVDVNTQRLNRRLAQVPSQVGSWLHFIDASAIFEEGGRIQSDRFLDPLLGPPDPPLHPTAATQTRLAEFIEPVLEKILGDRKHGALD